MYNLLKDFSISTLVAGFISTLIAYAGPLVIIFQVTKAAGYPEYMLSSWIWSISVGSGILGIILSLRFKVPVIIAWSVPGSALLVTLLPGIKPEEAVGAYLIASTIILLIGLCGIFDKIVSKLPAAVSAAMLAGILFSFGSQTFVSIQDRPFLAGSMFFTYLLCKRFFPQYAVMAVLLVGSGISLALGDIHPSVLTIGMTAPHWITPVLSWHGAVNIALPLVVVALTGQFVPGIGVLRNDHYQTPSGPIVVGSAITSFLLAPFGCHGVNLAAITAAICTGREAHEDMDKRYVAGVMGGLFYVVLGLFGATAVAVFSALPREMISALAGLALFGAIGNSLSSAMSVPTDREAALITFLVTSSGFSLFGLSAAFWGLIFGMVAHSLLTLRRPLGGQKLSIAEPSLERATTDSAN